MDEALSHRCSCSERRDQHAKDVEATRPATEEEEAWLQWEEQFVRSCEENMATGFPPSRIEEAEVFDIHDEVACWMQAEKQVSAIEEAELICRLEEQELAELANSEDVHRHLMMKSLIHGAKYLVDEKYAKKADYQVLISVQQAAKTLLELVDQTIYTKMEEECCKALNQCKKAMLLQREAEAAAAQDRVQLKAEISKLKKDYRGLNEKLEREKDRTTCRICFTNPRDVLPLPCMHFDYCHACLHHYQRMRNICPTCRSPISGVLKYNLTID